MWHIILLSCLGSALADTYHCSYGEEYSECNAKCDPYCDWTTGDIVNPPCPNCCDEGCVCKAGYVRTNSGTGFHCMPESRCKSCGANAYYSSCSYHCQRTCENKDEDIMCAMMCRGGCVCKEGYVRKGYFNTPCIPEEECENEYQSSD